MRTKKYIDIESFSHSKKLVDKFYNFHASKKLMPSVGVSEATFPILVGSDTRVSLDFSDIEDFESVEGLAVFRQYFKTSGRTLYRLLVYCNNEMLYFNQMFDGSSALFTVYDETFDSPPIALAFKIGDNDAIILASKDKMMIWETGFTPYTVTNAPIVTSMCMNEGALFCTLVEPAFKIWYATDLRAENIGALNNNSGYIVLADDLGYARKIVTFNESVYVFRDYGISKINNVKGEMSVSQVYLSNTKIFTNTVAICGNVILFLTNDGVQSFNGMKVTKIDVDLSNILSKVNDGAVASSLGNNYYIALKLDFDDNKQILCEANQYTNNALVVLDINSYDYQIVRGVDVKSLLPIMAGDFECMLMTFNSAHKDKVGQIISTPTIFNEAEEKSFLTKELSGNVTTKLFTSLTVNASAGLTIKLLHDSGVTTFTTYASGKNEFNFKITSSSVKLEINSSSQNAEIRSARLGYYEY